MHTEYPSVHHSSKTEIVKDIAAISPDIHAAIFSLALVIETVHLGDLSRLVVAADQGDPVWIANLEKQEEQKRLNRIETSIYEIA